MAQALVLTCSHSESATAPYRSPVPAGVRAPRARACNAFPVTTRTCAPQSSRAYTVGLICIQPYTWRHRQALVNNKFMGYAFATALGVSPSVNNTAHPKV